MGGKRTRLFVWAAALSVASLVGTPSLAQQGGPGGYGGEVAPTGEYREGVTVGDWKLFPKIYVGAVWDTNIDQQPSGFPTHESGVGARAVPYINGFYDGGIHKTSVYGVADARFFDDNTLSATAGLTHRYE